MGLGSTLTHSIYATNGKIKTAQGYFSFKEKCELSALVAGDARLSGFDLGDIFSDFLVVIWWVGDYYCRIYGSTVIFSAPKWTMITVLY